MIKDKDRKTLYFRWHDILRRCNKSTNSSYNRYGARGITVCEEWTKNFQSFFEWAMNNGFHSNLTLDRINNNGPYSPENCRWATQATQQNNKRSNHYITFRGTTMSMAQWCRALNLPYFTVRKRLYDGWDIERALTQPIEKSRLVVK